MSAIEELIRVKNLLSDPSRWTTGTFARGIDGKSAPVDGPKPVRFCWAGALMRCNAKQEAFQACLAEVGAEKYISRFNDNRGHAAVLAAIDSAIAKLSYDRRQATIDQMRVYATQAPHNEVRRLEGSQEKAAA